MPSKILVPIDYSKNAINAAKVAMMLASFKGDTTVHLLHVVIAPPLNFENQIVSIEDFTLQAKEKMKKVESELKGMNYKQEVILETTVEVGMPIDQITSKIKTKDYDLIIMGTLGASGLKKAFIGSVASSVLNHVDCPLLLIPQEYSFEPELWEINKILFSVDNSIANNKFIVQIEQFANNLKASINCLQVQTKEEQNETETFNSVNHYPIESLTIADKSPKEIASSVQQYAKENEMDIIAIVHHKKNILEKLFKKSVVMEMLYSPIVPLLIYKE